MSHGRPVIFMTKLYFSAIWLQHKVTEVSRSATPKSCTIFKAQNSFKKNKT